MTSEREMDKEDCVDTSFLTTYRQHFQPYEAYNFPKKSQKNPQRDPMLLTGHFQNNLQVNGHTMKSKVWPDSQFGVEEYKSFIEKLQRCKKVIYDLFFDKQNIRTDLIEDMLKDLEQTVYQHSYSPNVYVTVSERKRVQMDPVSANMKYHETTYRTYYNRIEELERFKKFMVSKLCKEDREAIKKELRKIYITGRSNYYETICLPAIAMAKVKPMIETPIDIHSWRKV